LHEGGVLALFWKEDNFADMRVREAYTAAYERRGIEIRSAWSLPRDTPGLGKTVHDEWQDGWPPNERREASRYFTTMRIHRYNWTRRVPVADYVARMNTTSAHLILPAQVRDDMTAELLATLTGYGEDVVLEMTTELATAIRR
jgi:hypothetical protein